MWVAKSFTKYFALLPRNCGSTFTIDYYVLINYQSLVWCYLASTGFKKLKFIYLQGKAVHEEVRTKSSSPWTHLVLLDPEDEGTMIVKTLENIIIIIIIIIINIKNWILWSVPSPELQLLSPTFLRSPNCSSSLWSVVIWFQRDSVWWHSLQV